MEITEANYFLFFKKKKKQKNISFFAILKNALPNLRSTEKVTHSASSCFRATNERIKKPVHQLSREPNQKNQFYLRDKTFRPIPTTTPYNFSPKPNPTHTLEHATQTGILARVNYPQRVLLSPLPLFSR